MTDKEFRNQTLILPNGFSVSSRGTVIGNDIYKPDLAISMNGLVTTVVESSSTGDRKVALGEMFQAHKYFVDANRAGILIFSLCGTGATAPTPVTQVNYLRPYFEFLCRRTEIGILKLYILQQSQFLPCISELLTANDGVFGVEMLRIG